MELEEVLRTHRDAAMRLLADNQNQLREGVELLVKNRMPAILVASRDVGEPPLSDQQADQLYMEILALAYNLFAVGYSVSKLPPTPGNGAAKRR